MGRALYDLIRFSAKTPAAPASSRERTRRTRRLLFRTTPCQACLKKLNCQRREIPMMKPYRRLLVLIASTWLLYVTAGVGYGQRQFDPNRPEVLSLPVLPTGFVTESVSVQSGHYLIDVLNRSGIRNLRVEVDKMPGASLAAASTEHTADGATDAEKSRFAQLVHLTPGTYRVLITGHPTWICAINVK